MEHDYYIQVTDFTRLAAVVRVQTGLLVVVSVLCVSFHFFAATKTSLYLTSMSIVCIVSTYYNKLRVCKAKSFITISGCCVVVDVYLIK